MRPREVRVYLHDIVQACALLKTFTRGRSYEEYVVDVMFRSAVERQFTIIGEALNQALKAQPSLAARISHTGKIVAFRNRLIHAYGEISDELVWEVLEQDIDVLIVEVERILAERAR